MNFHAPITMGHFWDMSFITLLKVEQLPLLHCQLEPIKSLGWLPVPDTHSRLQRQMMLALVSFLQPYQLLQVELVNFDALG